MNEQEEVKYWEKFGAFEELIRTKGWEYIKAYYLTKVQDFTTKILTGGDIDINQFEGERQQLIGINKLLLEVTTVLDNGKRRKEQDKRVTE